MTQHGRIASFLVVLTAPACFSPTDPQSDPASTGMTSDDGSSQISAPMSGDGSSEAESASEETSDSAVTDSDASNPSTTDVGTTDTTDTTTDDVTTTDDGTTTDDDTTDDGTTTDAVESTDAEATTEPASTTDTGMPEETRVVFATSVPTVGAIGPVANDICQGAADDAGLDGTFLAWLSIGNTSPSNTFTQFDGPYVRTDGVAIAQSWDALVDGDLLNAINHDENGDAIVGGQPVWTNTDVDGTTIAGGGNAGNCTAFTSMSPMQTAPVGRTAAADEGWTDEQVQSCAAGARLYCFEQ